MSRTDFTTIRTEGAMLPADILRRIAAEDVPGMKPTDYDLPTSLKLNEAIGQAWTRALAHWADFQVARDAIREDDETGTVATRQQWLMPLLEILGFGKLNQQKSPEIEGKPYPIQFFWQHLPMHLLGCKLPIDRRSKGVAGAATSSPHSLVQEFLNRSDGHLWAVLTNGLQWRILRDNVSLSRQAYVEFDLESMMEGEVYSDFALLWLVCHVTRFEADQPEQCYLEAWSHLAVEEGTRILGGLRQGVTEAAQQLGEGFIGHPANNKLRDLLRSGELPKQELYREILRIIYRLLFLFVAEDRELLHLPDATNEVRNTYRKFYSTKHFRELADRIRGTGHGDLWQALTFLFARFGDPEGCPALGLPGLGSFLWSAGSTPELLGSPQSLPEHATNESRVEIDNEHILAAIRVLAYAEVDGIRRMVDYRSLGTEELGSVYESLLELVPDVVATETAETSRFDLRSVAGNERKLSGSYYTPDTLVQCLLDSALEPVVADRIKDLGSSEKKAEAILSIKVCDPAVGSGHFLIAAAHRLSRHLARWRTGELEPAPEDYQSALRDVIRHCVYGVDINPMAAELCKVALWIESMDPGMPLSFLDSHIQVGNSLLGSTPGLLDQGVPDRAFKLVEGDDKTFVSDLKKLNKQELVDREGGQSYLFESHHELGNLSSKLTRLSEGGDDTVTEVVEKERQYAQLLSGPDYLNARLVADTWCAVFMWIKDASDLGKLCPTERVFRKIEHDPHSILPQMRAEVNRLADQYQFFHWHLAFPDVFRRPEMNGEGNWISGFDVIVGNPPWDKIQPEETKFFEAIRSDIAKAKSAKKRKMLIAELSESDPELAVLWQNHKRQIEATSHLLKSSNAYPLSGGGNLNLYRSFTELNMRLISRVGRAGIIVQTALATGDTGKRLFDYLMSHGRLVRFLDFENRKRFFQDVHIQFRFCLLTLRGEGGSKPATPAEFGWLLHKLSDMTTPRRLIELSAADLKLFNPSSQTCPIITSQQELEITRLIYRNTRPLYISQDNRFCKLELLGELFNLTRDSTFFVDADADIEEDLLRLWEAKYLHQFDHRYATFDCGGVSDSTEIKKESASFTAVTSKLVATREVLRRVSDRGIVHKWLCGFRRISSATNERTAIMAIFPLGAVGNTINLAFGLSPVESGVLVGNTNAFVFDFACRQKISGTDVNIWIYKQLPVIDFYRYKSFPAWDTSESLQKWQLSRVLELTYTAWDLETFAQDCGYSGPPFRWDKERRFQLRCELDAAYFHLYLGARGEWSADTNQLSEMFSSPRDAVDYIMETFPIVKRRDIKSTELKNATGEVVKEGTYITKDTILAIYDEMAESIAKGITWKSPLDPPPLDPRAAHSAEGTKASSQSPTKRPA